MPKKKRNSKAREAFDKAIVARVTKEMAQPRFSESAQDEGYRQGKGRHVKRASRPVATRRSSRGHI